MYPRILLFLALGLAGAACGPRSGAPPPPPAAAAEVVPVDTPPLPPPGDPAPREPSSPGRPYTIDDRFADLARVVPGGFGGLWLEGDELHVNLVDLSKRAEAQAVLARELRAEFGGGAPGQRGSVDLDAIVFHSARYDYLQLTGWYARLTPALGEGIVSTDIDERANRIAVGVRDEATIERVRRRVVELGIPPEAVVVARQEPVQLRRP